MTDATNRLRAEIADLEGYIAGLPEELRAGPYGAAYLSRLDLLREQLHEQELVETAQLAGAPAMDLRIFDDGMREAKVSAQLLGELLQRWQGLYSALGQSAAGRPTSRGVIPTEILEQTALDVVAFASGSFVIRMVLEQPVQARLPAGDLGLLAFEQFQELCQAGAEHHSLSVLMRRLKGRVMSSYVKLLQLLDASGASLDVSIAEPRGTMHRTGLRAEQAHDILPSLSQVSTPAEENRFSIVGVLNAAHRRTRTFEIDLGEEGTLSGRVGREELLEGVTIGERYTFEITEVVTRNPFTGDFETSFVLESRIPHP